MYTLVSAIALKNEAGAQWKSVNLSQMLVAAMYLAYRRIVITATVAGEAEKVIIDLEQLKAEYATYPNTLPVLLEVLGHRSLETLPALPSTKIQYARYANAIRVGYKAHHVKRGYPTPSSYPKSELTDLELLRPQYETELALLHTQAIVSVNGMVHLTDTDGQKAYIVDGGKTCFRNNVNHIGITSFASIGPLEKIRIDPSHVQPRSPEQSLKDRVTFSVDASIEGKAFFLVLGGYLVFPQQDVFYPTSDHSFHVDLNRLAYLERILEASKFLDLSSLELTASELNPENLQLEELWSDAVIRRYFALSQTHLVIVDTPSLFLNKVPLRRFQEPGRFTAYQEPRYPLIVGHGRLSEYWKVKEGSHWAVTLMDSYWRNYTYQSVVPTELTNVTGQLRVDDPYYHSRGFLLEIGAPGE